MAYANAIPFAGGGSSYPQFILSFVPFNIGHRADCVAEQLERSDARFLSIARSCTVNDLTGLRWLRKDAKSRERTLESWAEMEGWNGTVGAPERFMNSDCAFPSLFSSQKYVLLMGSISAKRFQRRSLRSSSAIV